MIMRILACSLLIVGFLLVTVSISNSSDRVHEMEAALERAMCFVGVDSSSIAIDSIEKEAQLVESVAGDLPVLGCRKGVSTFWKFTLPLSSLIQRDPMTDSLSLPADLRVFVEAVQDTGIVWIRSVKPGYDPIAYVWDSAADPAPLVPPKLPFPVYTDSCPSVSFIEAASARWTGFAKRCAMLEAVCVQRTDLQGNTAPAWLIVEHDCDTKTESKYPSEPKNVTRHWRTYIDANTGAYIKSGNLPMSKVEQAESRSLPER
jgi:hypothetical protein